VGFSLHHKLTVCALSLVFAAAAPLAAPAASEEPRSIEYTVTPEVASGALQDLAVEMSFRAGPSGVTKVDLPNSWSGATQLYRAVHDLAADKASVAMAGPAVAVLTSKPGAEIKLSYKLKQDFQGVPSVSDGTMPFRPATQPKWFTTVGWTLFPSIEGRRADPVSFRWGSAPQGWTLASDLERKVEHARRIDDLLDSVLTGGEGMTVIERQAGGGRLRLAVHGKWQFSEAKLADLQSRIAETSADFWKDRGKDFLMVVTPLAAPKGETAQYGLGLGGDAFSLWATSDADEGSLRHILAHEHQHAWFPSKVGGVRTGAGEPLDYWLSEGFTDFYTLRILLRSGVWSLDEFVADYNRILRDYAMSPVREAPNGLIAAKFWKDRAVADLPYQRGLMLAAMWDDRMRRASGGKRNLDAVILAMKDVAGSKPVNSAVTNLRIEYAELGGGNLAPDYQHYVNDGARVMLPADLFGDCATVRTTESGIFNRGFDEAATKRSGGVIAGVDASGPAYAAGLRNGMRLIGPGASAGGDPRADLIYQVQDGGSVKTIRYKPLGHDRFTLQQIELAQGMTPEKRATCTKRMAGA
jgi:predicted metalloprotease with PDZ domain